MSWRYQAVLTDLKDLHGIKYPVLQVHEVYTDEFGYTIDGMKPSVFWEDDGEPDITKMHLELIEELETMLRDLKKYPPLDKRED